MMFDNVPEFFSRRTLAGFTLSDRYLTPPMPFAMSGDEALALAGRIDEVRRARDVRWPPGCGVWRAMSWKPLDHLGFVRRHRPSMTLLEFR